MNDNELIVTLRDGTAVTFRNDPQIPAMRRSFVDCMAGRKPFVMLTDAAGGGSIKIYSDEIVSVV